ncbi:MAG: MATE family efflux transporter [Chthoniobacteraceae bacterium]|nr:MATE family efflux transporter [Chthoniobacteraceae bacterium]
MRELLAIALPMMASTACEMVMTFTARLFLAKLGTAQMNAALGGGLMSFLMVTFFAGLLGYSTALVAQYYGARQKHNCAKVVTQAFLIALAAYPLILIGRPLVENFFRRSGIAPEQLEPQLLYFRILVWFSFIGLLRSVFSGFFSGIGRTRMVMFASLTSMLINIPAAYVLIFGKCGFPAMGIRGAAYGAVLAGMSGVAILAFAYFFGKQHREFAVSRSFRFDPGILGKLVQFGYPAGLEFFLNFAAFNAMIAIFHSCGQVIATAATVTYNWDMVAFVPLIGIEIAVTSMVGRYMGALSPDYAHRATLSGLKTGLIYSGAMLVAFVAAPGFLVNVFRPAANSAVFSEALPLSLFMVRLVALYVLLEAVVIAFSGALRGAGDTQWAMRISVLLHWMLVGILFVMLKVMHVSPETAWVVTIVWFLLFSMAFVARYRAGNWRNIRVIQEDRAPGLNDGFHETADL